MSHASDLECRATFTVEYRTKSFVDDALYFAKWILRLRAAPPEERVILLRELDSVPVDGDGAAEERKSLQPVL